MIKNKTYLKRTSFGLMALLAVFIYACTDFDELNTPSNQLVADQLDESLLGQQFAQSQFHGVRGNAGPMQLGKSLFGDLYSQYFATTFENFDSDQYIQVGGWANGAWNYIYATPGPQIAALVDFTEENNLPVLNAVAKVWKVNIFHTMTDQWGPIIYSEYNNGQTSVPYDSQQDVYNQFFQELESAIGVLQNNLGASAYGNDDLVYSGNVQQWLLFANSLRLRLAMRIVYADESLARQQAEAAVNPANGGVIEENADNAFVFTTENNMNPMNTITNWGEFRMSATMQSVLQGYEDPRISTYFNVPTSPDFNDYQGLRNGLTPGQKDASLNAIYSDLDTRWLPGGNPPIEVLRASEVWLLRAEGAIRGWDMGVSGQVAYETGIRRSMQERPAADEAGITAYLASNNTPADYENELNPDWNIGAPSNAPVAWAGDFDTQLEQIAIQKWLALYPDGIQAWAEMRRLGAPFLPIIESRNSNVSETQMMRRLSFVQVEYDNNSSATNEARNLLNGDDNNATRVWWDARN
ncbi:MAG: SusD/RagB family nutrient-binding outer membrane lipoprotein [Balneolaceae bacterium]|nr:SusD/RagB family nutrient-binding outer membrane lipoprotein [Balneolaceae bacterium]